MATKTSVRKKVVSAKRGAGHKPVKKAAGRPAATSAGAASEDGRADFEALAAEYKKVPPAQVVMPRFDVQAAITHALGIAQRVQAPAVRKRFLAMPADELPPAQLDQLAPAARAARYAFLRLSTTKVSTQKVKVSLEIVQEATAVRGRMLEVCAYLLGDQPKHAAEVSAIRQGKGYQDLADDLSRLAVLYDQESAVVQKDPKNYRAEDRAAAQQLAAQILAEVAASDPKADADSKGGKVPAARAAAYRAFAFLDSCYSEVAAAGRYLFRHADGEEIFCSLWSAGRRKAKPSRPATPKPVPAAE